MGSNGTDYSLQDQDSWRVLKCSKLNDRETHLQKRSQDSSSNPVSNTHLQDRFRVWLEICSPDSFCVRPDHLQGFPYPGDEECFRRLTDILADVISSHYTQNNGGGKSCVYKLRDYDSVLSCLQKTVGIKIEKIPCVTYKVVEKFSHSFTAGRWEPCRPEHLSDERVDELVRKLPRKLFDALLPFQHDGLRFGLRRGGRCLIADEMGLGKTLQAIAIAGCFMNGGSVLVVCPAVLRYSWAEELERWLPNCLPSDIHLVFGHRDNPVNLLTQPKVVVISYKMLQRLWNNISLQEWAVLIVDESHHLRCSKKKSEAEETKALLDVSARVKHIILLSGTPSLSRPFDIFHQVNILWPRLLGLDKYEFARTYCAVNLDPGYQGFKDFSKGIRLEELNVLLKLTVMIRRLKDQVLVQLPPKRRKLIMLKLTASDVAAAKAAVRVQNDDAADKETDFDVPDENEGGVGCQTALKLSHQELGIAKLTGFREWLSIHPIVANSDSLEESGSNAGLQKMIIFGHHHKVLDGIQEFICTKGVGFVRIDGTTLPKDRQTAVKSFQSSNEVKVAIIGTTAGGVGLDFSSAQNVVFLELPESPSIMLQAEDRAHRRGQKSSVNVYIFSAKDSLDELRWQSLNKRLFRVSSTTNGKYDAIQEIAIECLTELETSHQGGNQNMNSLESVKQLPESKCFQDVQSAGECHDMAAVMHTASEEPTRPSEHLLKDILPYLYITKEDSDAHIQSRRDASCSQQTDNLRFEVSRYTGRIHLYSCIPGSDSRPKPLFESFRPEELELLGSLINDDKETFCRSFPDKPDSRNALLAFIDDWNKLRPIEQQKLLGRPLQLPLSVELQIFKESINHNTGGLLKGKSLRRTTPLSEISLPLPVNAVWKNVYLRGGQVKKEKAYTQGWSCADEPLCKLCQIPCKGRSAKTPEYFEDMFCNLDCYQEYRLRTSNSFLREGLFQIEYGVCTNCKLNCHQLVIHLKPLPLDRRREYIEKVAPIIASRKNLLEKLVNDPSEGNAWHADHIVPVYKGGGECKLENMRTLCVACHNDVTAAQCSERRSVRNKAKRKLKAVIGDLQRITDAKTVVAKDPVPSDITVGEDDLLMIKVPGSSYSGASSSLDQDVNFFELDERTLMMKLVSVAADGLEAARGDEADMGMLKKVIEEINRSSSDEEISCVVADMILGWALEVAKNMGIVPIGATLPGPGHLALAAQIPQLIQSGILDGEGNVLKGESISLSSDIPPWKNSDLSWTHKDPSMRKFIFHLSSLSYKYIEFPTLVLVNMFEELAPSALKLTHKTLPIGPLLSNTNISGPSTANLWPEDSTCLTWLDAQASRSVIYVSFGSSKKLNQAQFQELALGLELTGKPFLWVVRADLVSGSESSVEFLPESFMGSVGERGKLVKWAPQEKVLAHHAVACFVSHCGWNSIMESLSMGVPFLCWPYVADQFHNRNYVCDGWEVGVNLEEDENGIISRDEFSRKVITLLSSDTIKENVLRLKQAARASVEEGGSSWKNFQTLINLIMSLH